MTLSWADPAISNFAGVMIRRAPGTIAPSGPTAGTLVASEGTTVTSYTDAGLSPGATYSYALFAYDAASDYALAATITVTLGTAGPLDVSGTLTQNTTWSPSGASAYIIQGSLDVPAGVTLTLDPGTVVKALGGGGQGYSISVEGTLDAVGTAASPITFTSVNDNSAGGATGTGSPAAGDWDGITLSATGSADIEHATISYPASALFGVTTGTLTMAGDDIASAGGGITVTAGTATVTGSTISLAAATPASAPAGVALNAGTVVLENNKVSDPATGWPAYMVTSSALNFGHLTGNTATGAGQLAMEVAGSAVTSTWDGSLPLELDSQVDSGLFGSQGGDLDVPAGVTLTLDPGTVVKALGGGGQGYSISVEGTLDAVGTAASPITFTSVNDNSAGGATGTGSPAAGDWDGITVTGNSAGIDLQHATVSYAVTATAIDASSAQELSGVTIQDSDLALNVLSGSVAFRGSFTDNTMDIRACDWNSTSCGVDAAYTNWGDGSSGPFPSTGALICGAVTVAPWLPDEGTSATFSDGNCSGGPTPDVVLSNTESSYDQEIANDEALCGNGNQDICQAIQTAQNCLSAAYGLAESTSPFTLPALGGDVVTAGSSWLEGSESQTISDIGGIADFANDILGAVSTILNVANAYNQCDP